MYFHLRWRHCSFIVVLVILAADAIGGQQPPPVDVQFEDRRHVNLEGQSNFRDIGGYETEGGRLVKWGHVYRTGELPRLIQRLLIG